MYESFYNLKEKPFELHPDPDFLFMSPGHDTAYTLLEYAISENKGFVIITGDIGSGKTTLLNFFLNRIPSDIHIGLINNTYAPQSHFSKMICQEFELDVEGKDTVEMMDVFHDFLLTQYAENKRVVLIIDEAQNLTPNALEELRMISNLEAEKQHLIQMILVGQPELKSTLQHKNLEQFVQRVTVHCHLAGLDKEETSKYIRYRLEKAGAKNQELFHEEAIECIFEYAKGIPRVINVLCDTALVYGFADGLETIEKKVIEEVINTRVAGGMFSIDKKAEQSEPLSQPAAKISSHEQASDISIKLIEQRVAMFEITVDHLRQRLDKLSQKKDERDALILELFKMLKSSLDSRANTLMQFKQYKNKMEKVRTKPEEEKIVRRHPFTFGLKKKQKKSR